MGKGGSARPERRLPEGGGHHSKGNVQLEGNGCDGPGAGCKNCLTPTAAWLHYSIYSWINSWATLHLPALSIRQMIWQLSFSKIIDFLFRKSRLYFRKVFCVGVDAVFSPSANIAFTSEFSVGEGSLRIGSHSLIDRGVVIRTYGGRVEIGSLTTIGPYSCIYGGGDLIIGNGVRMGPSSSIIAGNHVFSDLDTPIYLQGVNCQGIEISDNVWIGAGVTILDGVKIGEGAIIAAGAVVSKSIPAMTVVGGVPAMFLKSRNQDKR